ncbi:unnamed protein product [Bemisia tabaci]|uniref:Anaphase-promoting complex subunit 15 n=1 Tax=Bemisia tabaci TaxID=7038 RepID=A0A9P0ABK9_BEMTA|nr:PREDICTED: anaphase-promoting complex subunit 15B-like [Bemisia tabaci]CAH0388285.1 unnamed protein product [Bemisia tabaci]
MAVPLFPTLSPRVVDPLWFSVDKPKNDESDLAQQEQQHQSWMNSIGSREAEFTPIGKTSDQPAEEEDDEEEEEEDNDDDDSETHDDDEDELEMEVTYERDSPVDPLR